MTNLSGLSLISPGCYFVAIWPRHFKSLVIKAQSGPTFVRLGCLTHNRDISWSMDRPSREKVETLSSSQMSKRNSKRNWASPEATVVYLDYEIEALEYVVALGLSVDHDISRL